MLSAATTFFGIGVYAVLQCALPVYEASKLQNSQTCNVNPSFYKFIFRLKEGKQKIENEQVLV